MVLFASVEICASTSKIIEEQQENETFVSSAILFSPPPFSLPKSPPPPLFGLKKTNQYFENEPKIDTFPKRLEIEKMKDRKCIEEKIAVLKKQLGELQESLDPIKLALEEDDRLNVAQQENQQELALIQKQLKDNQQKLLQLEKPDPVNILKLSTGLNKSQDICFIEQQRFSEINTALEKFKVALPSKILKSEEIKVLKETIERLQIDKTNLEEKIALNNQALAALHSLVNNQILFKDFKALLERKKTIEQSLTRTIGLLKKKLKTLCPNLMLSPALKERRNSARPDLAQVLKTHPILISTYPELELVSNFLNDQNASIKLRGDDFHKDLSVD